MVGHIQNPNPLENGEIECDDVEIIKGVLITGILNIAKECSAKEIIICENFKKIDKDLRLNKGTCNYGIYFFSKKLI